jgi:hypothetical protein
MVARRWDIGELGPSIGSRIVDLVRWGIPAGPADAADRVDLAVEHGGRQCAARGGKGRRSLPPIARRVVFVHLIGWRPALDEAADDVERLSPPPLLDAAGAEWRGHDPSD